MAVGTYIKEKVKGGRILWGLLSFIGAIAALDQIYKSYLSDDYLVPFTWAATVVVGIFVFFGLLNYCLFAQSLMQDEINRLASVKERLEKQVLNRRKSSKKRK